jgi:hypothetical protein
MRAQDTQPRRREPRSSCHVIDRVVLPNNHLVGRNSDQAADGRMIFATGESNGSPNSDR